MNDDHVKRNKVFFVYCLYLGFLVAFLSAVGANLDDDHMSHLAAAV